MSINPEVCGLNANVLYGYHNGLVNTLWADMIKLYPNVSATYGKNTDWDEVVRNISEDILKTLPELFNVKKVKTFYGDKCANPNIIVLLQELEQFNALLDVMRNILTQLSKVGITTNTTCIYLLFASFFFLLFCQYDRVKLLRTYVICVHDRTCTAWG